MARRNRRIPAGRRPPRPVSASGEDTAAADEAELEEEALERVAEPAAVVAASPSPPSAGMSPLLRSQEIELEIGLTVLGAMVGGLTGYGQNVAMDAPSGNLAGGVEGALVGGLLGYSLGRTLFLSVRAQWISWFVLIGLAVLGGMLAGLKGTLGGAVLGTGLVLAGVFGREGEVDSAPGVVPARRTPAGGGPSELRATSQPQPPQGAGTGETDEPAR